MMVIMQVYIDNEKYKFGICICYTIKDIVLRIPLFRMNMYSITTGTKYNSRMYSIGRMFKLLKEL